MNSLKRLTLELVKKVVIFEIKRDNETHPFNISNDSRYEYISICSYRCH